MRYNIIQSNGSYSSLLNDNSEKRETVYPNILSTIWNMTLGNQETSSSIASEKENEIVKPKAYSNLTVYDETAWKKYFDYDIEGEIPERPSETITSEIITQMTKTEQKCELEGTPTFSLTLIPKGLNLEKLEFVIKKPIEGKGTSLWPIYNPIRKTIGNETVDKTYWVLFYERIIQGTRNKHYKDQKAIVRQKTFSNSQGTLPGFLEALTCIAFKRAVTGERLFSNYSKHTPDSYIRCKEKIDQNPLMIGGFSHLGIHLRREDKYQRQYVGATACWKF
ncbi:MAG: hypothetical protein AAGG81_03490 [Chlamydiota bacterium]